MKPFCKLVLVPLIFSTCFSFSQTKDKSWLLVDSIDYKHLHSVDKNLLDSVLQLYHLAKQDSVRLQLLNDFIEACHDENLWPKYNLFMLKMAQKGNNNMYLTYQAAALNNIGYEADNKGNIAKAIDYYNRALKLREQAGDKRGIAESINNLGSVYSRQDDKHKTIDYYTKAIQIYEEIGDKQGAAYSLANLGNTYNNLDDPKKAIECDTKALQIQKELDDKQGMSNSLSNLGAVYEDLGDNQKAISFYSESLQLREQIGSTSGIAEGLNDLGDVYYTIKNFPKAEECALKSFEVSKKIGFPLEIKNAAHLLYKIYKKQNHPDKALAMYELYSKMRDSTNNINLVRETASAEYTFKEAQLNIEHEKETAIAEARSQKQRLFLWLIALAATGAVIIALVIFRNLQQNKKAKKIIEQQKEIVEEKQKEILDSIRYAKRIQDAVLKEQEHISAHLPPHFVLFRPKDIVSGDFYWSIEKNDHWYIAAADCTGHGVPGAFLTILGTSFLNEITATDLLLTPAEILDKLRDRIIKELSITNKETNSTKDGMDISLARLNLKTNEFMWAGANNPLWIIPSITDERPDIKEINPHKQPIGFYPTITPYPNHSMQLHKGDTFYLFTDGYVDQFGGPKGKKYKYKQLEKLLVASSLKSLEEQKNILFTTFDNWKGNLEQVDDVTIIGIRI